MLFVLAFTCQKWHLYFFVFRIRIGKMYFFAFSFPELESVQTIN